MKTRPVFKSILSVSLVIALLVCSVPMTTVAAIASSTNNIPNYITFQAELYSSEEVGFDNIFVGTDSSSFARTYFNDMRNDDKFIASVNAWEAIHIATSPSYSLESGKINKKDFYETILFDMLDVSDNGSLASEFGSTYSKLFKAIKNQNNSFVISTANKIMGKDGISADELNTFKYADLSDDAKKLLLNGSKYAEVSSVVSDVNKLLGYAKSAYEAIEKVSDYLSIKEYQDGTKEILDYIVSDTRNDPQLRLAAGTVSECFDKSFDSVLIAISEGTLSGLETCLGEVMDGAWGEIVAAIPGGSAVLLAAKGSRLLCNYLFSTDKEIEGYYLLEASVKMEDAFIRALTAAQDDMKKDSVGTATVYMQGISMYKNVILLGFDYSIDLLETAANSKLNTSTDFWLGNYSECISLMNDVESFKTQKINNYAAYENMVFNAYKQKYFPNYDEVESSLDKAKVLISSMEVNQIKNINIGDNGSIYDFFSFKYYPENHTELSVEDGVTSSDESVIKVTKNSWTCDSITAVGEGTCTLTFSSNLGEFSNSIEVTVGSDTGETKPENDWDIGLMYDKDKNIVAYIRAYNGNDTNIVVPAMYNGYSVTAISGAIFQDNTRIKRVTIPDAINSISNSCFKGCTSLEYVSLPSKLTSINSYMFYGCVSLNSITIPENVTHIGDNAFYNCSNLSKIIITDNVVDIESGAFTNCVKLENITLPISTRIVSNSFDKCTNIKVVNFSNGTNNWNINNYGGCMMKYICPDSYRKIETVTFPQGVSNIPREFFYDCEKLNKVVLPNSVTCIEDFAFFNCSSLTEIKLPDEISYIGESAFYNCKSLVNINLPTGLTKIEDDVFNLCSSLISIIIPDSVETIGDGAFCNCVSLKELTLPCSAKIESTSDVYSGSFYGCEKIEKITFSKGTGKMVNYDSYNTKLPQYISKDSLREVVLSNGIENIGSYAFAYCTALSVCSIPDSVKTIGEGAFIGCSSLDINELPMGITSIGEKAFTDTKFYLNEGNWTDGLLYVNDYLIQGKSNLNGTININNGITLIADGAFHNYCYGIEEIVLPDSLLYIGEYAFSMCYGLKKITIPKNVISIGNDAFEDCEVLENIFVDKDNAVYSDKDGVLFNKDKTVLIKYPLKSADTYIIPESVIEIYYCAFEFCNIENVIIPSSVKSIGDYAFFRSNLKTIEIPDSVTYLGKEAFLGCSNLENINIPSTIQHILQGTFQDCTKLSFVKIPNGITSIDTAAFSGCSELTTVFIPSSVISIGRNAFNECISLKILSLSKNIEEFDSYAFYGAESIEHIIFDGTEEEWNKLPTKWSAVSFDNVIFHYSKTAEEIFEEEKVPTTSYAKGYRIVLHCRLCDTDIEAEYRSEKTEFKYSKHLTTDSITGKEYVWISIDSYLGNDANIVIPSSIDKYPVYSISSEAFRENPNIKNVIVSENIKWIDECAFSGCDNIISVSLPKSIERIGDDAFSGCSSLETIIMLMGNARIGEDAFSGCKSLKGVYIDNLEDWLTNQFYEPTTYAYSNPLILAGNLYIDNELATSITLPECETFSSNALNGCTSITNIVVPNGTVNIGTGVFNKCSNLIWINLPSTISSIEYGAFSRSGLKHVFYEGTEDEWKLVTINDSYSILHEVPIHCNAPLSSQLRLTTIAPTCTERGYDAYHCSMCGKDYLINYKDMIAHTPEFVEIIPSTCTEEGYTVYRCKVCGYEYNDDYTDALGHNIVDGVCKNCGLDEYRCVESEHDYANNCDQTWTLNKPNAQSVAVTFSLDTYVERGYDFIYIYDANDALIGKYTGNELAGKRIVVLGDTVKIRLTSDGSNTGFGFAFSKVETNIPQDVESKGIIVTEGKIGDFSSDTRLKVESLETTKERIVYDISLMKGDTEIQPSMPVAVRIPVPANMNGENCKVYRQEADGTYTDMNAVYQDGYMVFTTDHFSVYVLTTNNPNVLFGDTNADGTIDDWDSVLLERYLAGWEVEINTSAADIDKNGVVDDWDGVLLARKLAGWK